MGERLLKRSAVSLPRPVRGGDHGADHDFARRVSAR